MSDANLLLLGVQLLPESDTQLLAQTLEGLEVLLVLVRALDLGLDACTGCVSDVFQLTIWRDLIAVDGAYPRRHGRQWGSR